jgi:hypothetical protein
MDPLTLAELLVINDQNLADLNCTDIVEGAPVLAALAATTASGGTTHSYLKESGAPNVGFRAVNEGRDHDHSEDVKVSIDLKVLDASTSVDVALADEYQHGPEAYLDREGRRHVRASLAMFERQIFRGTGDEDAAGFEGFPDSAYLDALADAMVIGAGGATALTSVYMIRSPGDLSGAAVVAGQSGKIKWGSTSVNMLEGSNGKLLPKYVTPITGWAGLQLGSAFSVARLANLDASANGLTDDLLSQLFELFPEDLPPTHIAMNRRSRGQLARSRSAYHPLGKPAPLPADWEGIPIISTPGLSNAETAVA